MAKQYLYLRYYPGDAYAMNKNDEIVGTVSPKGVFKPIGNRRVPPGEKRAKQVRT